MGVRAHFPVLDLRVGFRQPLSCIFMLFSGLNLDFDDFCEIFIFSIWYLTLTLGFDLGIH